MLKLINITKEYLVDKESTQALKGVSIEFRNNEFVSILGPSGCGKTTLLNIIGGLDRYTSGDIQIEGISTKQYDDVDWDTYRNRRIGFVFQSYNLIPHMNILKNVAMSLTIGGVERDECKKRAMEALKKVGLASQARKKPNQLSGGQMQRVAIARALVNNPEIILADEPTGALDSESGIQVMDLLKEVAEDRLVIMVTHNPMLAEEYSTRIVYLKDGEIEGDTMPYDSSAENANEEAEIANEEVESEKAEAENVDNNDNSDGGDGSSSGDYVLEEVAEDKSAAYNEQAEGVSVVADATSEGETAKDVNNLGESNPAAPKNREKKQSMLQKKLQKIRQADRSAMKLRTAISLSWTNLLSKSGRTLLTSIAGSIGIIGIILVLALSNGAGIYINGLEESALSSYPITVNESSMDVSSILGTLMSMTNAKGEIEKEDEIGTQIVLGKLVEQILNDNLSSNNDLNKLKKYIDENFDDTVATVKYKYGTTFNAYVADPKDENAYMKISPYSENMYKIFNDMLTDSRFKFLQDMPPITIFGQEMTITGAIGMMANNIGDPWSEISDNHKVLNSQYELLGNSRWPEKENEIIIVANENNTFFDYQLFMLGLKSGSEVGDVLISNKGETGEESAQSFPVNELIGREYKILTNADYLDKVENTETWTMGDNRSKLDKDFVDSHCMKFGDGTDTLKVVGVVRPKEGVIATSISGVIGYSSSLTRAMLQHAQDTEPVKKMTEMYDECVATNQDYYESVINFSEFSVDPDTGKFDIKTVVAVGDKISLTTDPDNQLHADVMRKLGFVDPDYPTKIEFYCSSFDSKDKIVEFFNQYAKSEGGQQIKYTDSLSSMMDFVNTMASTITGVLVAFAAISLVVSTIMIAIIIYTSVLERRKEIGVLRSIGARKKDISRVFIAESAILGAYSGIIGVIVSSIISLIGSAILKAVFNIEGLMTISWWHCVMMFLISVVLSILAGFIPSRIAANKDPAIALRSE